MQAGVWPSHDENNKLINYHGGATWRNAGRPLAGVFFARLFGLAGDLESFSQDLELEASNSNLPCFLCRATRRLGNLPWTDFSKTASCLQTIWDPTTWLEQRTRRHMVFMILGVSVTAACPDYMHTKHGGTDSHFYAPIFKYMVSFVLAGTPHASGRSLRRILGTKVSCP